MATYMNSVSDEAVFSCGVQLQCPRCRTHIPGLVCSHCAFEMRVRNGIVLALPAERACRYARFIQEYESIRMAEGRGSEDPDFYRALPYADRTGNNSQQWKIRARSFEYLTRNLLRQNSHQDGGRVLDLGAGNCWMSYRLALAGYRPFAIDLLTNHRDGMEAAEHYRERTAELFPRFQAEMTHLPFRDEQFDAAVFNASFHYSEDFESTLREALRCVRRGGQVVICDTPWYSSEESGNQMIQERRADFLRRYGTASDAINSLEYLTDSRLEHLEQRLSIRWSIHSPGYGLRWTLRPLIAKVRGKREPSRFCIYVARKTA